MASIGTMNVVNNYKKAAKEFYQCANKDNSEQMIAELCEEYHLDEQVLYDWLCGDIDEGMLVKYIENRN